MEVIKINNLNSYLKNKNIYIINKKRNIEIVNKEDVIKQIDNIVFFQKTFGGYDENIFPRIKCTIGKEIDNFKRQVLLIKKYSNKIKKEENLNKVDKYILENSDKLIQKVNNSINNIASSDYKSLIKRSMNKYEVCLGRSDESNLSVDDDKKIKISTIKYLTYNLKENDIYFYIKRLKRRDILINIEELIDYYILKEGLDENSEIYLKELVLIPNEELKVLERIILGKINGSEDEILMEINRGRKIDKNI